MNLIIKKRWQVRELKLNNPAKRDKIINQIRL